MIFSSNKNKSLSYNILNRVYFANLVTIIAIFCIIAFAVNIKFNEIRENMYLSNQELRNIILNNVKTVNDELTLISRYITSDNTNTRAILDYSMSNHKKYYAMHVATIDGDIEISTFSHRDVNKEYLHFFKSKPWKDKFVDGFYRSKFDFHHGDIPTRFIVKDLENGKILIAEVKLNYIYNELLQMQNSAGANSFIINKDGRILFHQDIELVLKQKAIFDIYSVDMNYADQNSIRINWGADNFDLYMVQYIPKARTAVVTYRPISNILYTNWLFLGICLAFFLIGLFLVFVDVKFAVNGIIKPILFIKKLIKKLEKEESIGQYVSTGYITDFNEMVDSIIHVNENFQNKKNSFLEYEKKFGYLFEQGPLVILLIDAKTGDIVEASSKALEFYGFSRDEFLSKRLQDLDADSAKGANIMTCDCSDNTVAYEARHILSNGDIKDVLIKKKNIEADDNKLGFCLIEDITWEKINKRNFKRENEANIYSPIFKISWKNGFMQDILSVSINTEIILGYRLEEMLADDFSFKNIIHPADFDKIFNEFNIKFRLFSTNAVKKDYEFLSSIRILKKNLEVVTCNVFLKFISSDDKNIDEVIGYFVDSSIIDKMDLNNNPSNHTLHNGNYYEIDGLKYKNDADKYKKIVSNLFSNSQEAMAVVGTDGKFIDVNDAFVQITGYSKEEAIGSSSNLLNSGTHDSKFFANLWRNVINEGYWRGHIWNKKKDGKKYLELLTISTVYDKDGSIENFIAIFSDISHAKEKEENLEQIAYYDALTKLPNRFLFSKKLNDAMINTVSTKTSIAVIYIDIDNFKPINDLHGHSVGDRLLIAISKNISIVLKENDVLARIGGDEFIAIVNDLTYKNEINDILEDILRAASRDIVINNKHLRVSASVGASLYPQKIDIDQDTLIEQADWAMYQSKLSGKNKYYIFDPDADKYFRDHYALSDRISSSLLNDEFSLLYQPILNIKTNKIVGLETFIARKTGNTILCEEILPLIANGYIYDDLVLWNIDMALKDQSRMRTKYGLDLKVSVNVTLELIHRSDFIKKFHSIAESREHNNFHMLELNIKDASSFKQPIDSNEILNTYKSYGISLILDQFGSKSTSIQNLKNIYADKLKVSKYLSLGVVKEADSLIILKSILTLSNIFLKEAIAKGVETSESMYLLMKAGYHNLQGGYIAPPMRLESIKHWLETYKIPDKLKHIEALKESELIWCNLAVMHKGWIKSLLDMLSASNFNKFDTKEFARNYSELMVESYKKHISDFHKVSIHVETTGIIMQILTNIEQGQSISKLVVKLKDKRDKILTLE
ncbi:bifunctional diguanylate cyclase/phosphodiesterase [Campylobacter sp. RM16187]|uniref:bifunctional diguanylate cyclase/phosphodiesterase n=1 Tax=Campylobacter sp. RM16187 TaxID=1660063 RepID=UPI0021B68A82|nr:diguanylate cyclase [Campylobacter sp. RM16187]QKG30071.1 PAS sensor-containing diguanylate cyclase/phosphodiesterase [Campylobacter sp. RM16187]